MSEFLTSRVTRRQRRVWSKRVDSWDGHDAEGLDAVAEMTVQLASHTTGSRCVDLGCGTGRLAIPLAKLGWKVTAVDISLEMIQRLQTRAAEHGAGQIACMVTPIEALYLPADSVDLVVSSYALHHLRDSDKERLIGRVFTWLRPGGQLVIADMMFGRGLSARDREIVVSKVRAFLRKGPKGWWRIAKNAVRFLLRLQERPLTMNAWVSLLNSQGFHEVTAAPIIAEAAVVAGKRPFVSPGARTTPPIPIRERGKYAALRSRLPPAG